MADENSFTPEQLVGHYRIVRLLGKGGMAEVYQAKDQQLDRDVALKFLPLHLETDRMLLQRFEQEARAASALDHPNIITIYDISEFAGWRFIVAEYVEGQTLRDYLRSRALAPLEVLRIAEQIASALSAAHQKGIVHRDIKPANVIVRNDGLVKVLDFGVAKLIELEEADPEAVTQRLLKTDHGVVMGTLSYMSPEQVHGQQVDRRTDMFSLGTVMYEMVTGRQPFAGKGSGEVKDAILKFEPPLLTSVVPGTPKRLAQIVNRALVKDREERCQSMKDLANDLKDLKQDLETESRLGPAPTPESGAPQATAPTTAPAASRESSSPEPAATQTLVIVGAGPKAAAIAAKAHVLARLAAKKGEAKPNLEIIVIERGDVAANWLGKAGFTDGKCLLGTLPDRDVGFPYNSFYGSEADKAMLEYSWQAFKILLKKTGYGEWMDRGRPQPRHEMWGRYIKWVLESSLPPKTLLKRWEVTSVKPSDGKLLIDISATRRRRQIRADGIVFTGPGTPKKMALNIPEDCAPLISNGRDYWTNFESFKGQRNICLIGDGEPMASIALSLLDLAAGDSAPGLKIDIINPCGAIFTRTERFRENEFFTNPAGWKNLDERTRLGIIRHAERSIFSPAACARLNQAERVRLLSGTVTQIMRAGNKLIVQTQSEHHSNQVNHKNQTIEKYDKVIVALGFDPFQSLELLSEEIRPLYRNDEECLKLQETVDEFLRISFDSAKEIPKEALNVHMPMIAGLKQGPGIPNLTCLGYLADSILAKYIPRPK